MYNDTFTTQKNINSIKIAIFSDVHYYYPNYDLKIFKKIKNQIINNKPNYICIIGDLIDEQNITDYNELINILNDLSIIAPIIYVMGNHEIKKRINNKWVKADSTPLKTALNNVKNLHLLEDSTIIDTTNNVCFYGFNPSYEHYEKELETMESFVKDVNKLKTTLSNDKYNILLIHTPINIYEYINNNQNSELAKSDLIISGHMHNSCLPFWFTRFINKCFKTTRGIISPQRRLFPKHAQGINKKTKDGFIYQGIDKLSIKTGFHNLSKLYSKHVHFITIKKDSK